MIIHYTLHKVVKEMFTMAKESETKSDLAGGIGAVAGAGAGIGTSIAAISAGGTVAGTSAAGITSGLAAMGSLIGGGMLAGVFVAAVPVLAGGFIGYKAFKKVFGK